MTADNKAYLTWNKIEKRYELHVGGKFKGYSRNLDSGEDTQESHKAGYDYLCELATEKGYTVHSDIKKGG